VKWQARNFPRPRGQSRSSQHLSPTCSRASMRLAACSRRKADGPPALTCRGRGRATARRCAWRYGDNAAMVLAKDAKVKPRDLAEQVAARLRTDDLIASRRGRRSRLHQPHSEGVGLVGRAAHRAARGRSLRRSAIGVAEKVNVEYVSANPTGPMPCRPLPRRGIRGCAGEPASVRGL